MKSMRLVMTVAHALDVHYRHRHGHELMAALTTLASHKRKRQLGAYTTSDLDIRHPFVLSS